jgi:TatD DNase family protein
MADPSLVWVDSHSHLDAPEFAADRGAVLQRAHDAGVTKQIIPALAFSGFAALTELAKTHPGLHPAYGLHPMYLAEHRYEHVAQLRHWLKRDECVAVGECGLDFFVDGLDPAAQREFFSAQLQLAVMEDLPVIVHARKALEEVILTIRRIGPRKGVVHSFSGSNEQAQELFKLGFCLGIGGPVTYERAARLRKLVSVMPEEFLLLETDSPDQPLSTHRGARNEPSYLPEIAMVVAQLRDISLQQLASVTSANAKRLFALYA